MDAKSFYHHKCPHDEWLSREAILQLMDAYKTHDLNPCLDYQNSFEIIRHPPTHGVLNTGAQDQHTVKVQE